MKDLAARILVLEDDEHILQLITDILESEGYSVLGLRHPELILEVMAREQPDLLLVDTCRGRAGEPGGATCHGDAGGPQGLGRVGRLDRRNGGADVGHDLCEVDPDLLGMHAEPVCAAGLARGVGGGEQRP